MGALASAEVYDPSRRISKTTRSMTDMRVGHAMVVLPSGKVLVTGGLGRCDSISCDVLDTAELYTP